MRNEQEAWGIEPVPERLRVLALGDLTLLWGNLAVSLLVIVAGALLVPALSLPTALLAVVVGAALGSLMVGAAALIGTDARVPAMVVLRAPLGRRGSYIPTTLNVLQCLGWTVFELLIIATAAAALSDELFGFEARWAWTLVFGAVAIALALLGPVGFVRRYMRRFALPAVLGSLVFLTVWSLQDASLGSLWSAGGRGGFPSFWQAVDLVVASVVSWVPLAADYTRFARSRRNSFWSGVTGFFLPTVWMFGLGVLLFLTRDLSDAAQIPAAVAAAGVASVLALVALTVDESDEAFANVYSGAVSLQNLFPAAPQSALVGLTTTLGTVGALVLSLTSFQSFLFLLGSCFVPLFAVLLADWLVAGRDYDRAKIFGAPAWRPGPIAAWVAGFALYQWLSPTGPTWWVERVEQLDPPTWGIGATLPSFFASFALGLLLASSRRTEGRPARA